MRFERPLTAALAVLLAAGAAAAQTSGSPGGAMQPSRATTQPYAAPPLTGGAMQSSTPASPTGGMDAMGGGSTGATAPTGAGAPLHEVAGDNIIATLQASGRYTKLLAGLKAANLTNLIATHPNLTLFAPDDDAFAALPPGQLDGLMKTPAQLQAVLAYHLVATTIKESDIKGHAAGKVQTADNKPVTIDGMGGAVTVDGVPVTAPGVAASNGIIYPIGKVLTPTG